MARLWFAFVIGLGGLAILLWLGTWQVRRLAEKETYLAGIETRIAADATSLPDVPDPDRDRYLPVSVTGSFEATPPVRMLASRRQIGAVFRNIAAFRTVADAVILVDVGWTASDAPLQSLPQGQMTLVGNLDWPNEADSFTPPPEPENGLWYARDTASLSQALGTQNVLLVLRDRPSPDTGATPWPVNTAGIPNDHLQYAITWFSLAAIWSAMTLYFVLRARRSTPKG